MDEDRGRDDQRAFLDLHCHSSASFDSLSRPADLVRVAAVRGLTHLAITDHDRIDGALRARDAAPPGLTVIVGEEILTREGDCLGLFLERPVPAGRPLLETLDAIHAQGGLAGLPHPFDGLRRSSLAGESEAFLEGIVSRLDFIEGFNARVLRPAANERAADFARRHRIPAVASSDAHSLPEVAIACTIVRGLCGTPGQLRDALADATLVPGRASYYLRGLTPVAKLLNRLRGQGRPPPASSSE